MNSINNPSSKFALGNPILDLPLTLSSALRTTTKTKREKSLHPDTWRVDDKCEMLLKENI